MEEWLREKKQCSGSKNKILFVDFVIEEDNCNMACQYCLTGASRFKEKHKNMGIKKRLVYEERSELKKQIDTITDILDAHFDIGILKQLYLYFYKNCQPQYDGLTIAGNTHSSFP